MISRIWHGWTTPENADVYEALLKEEIFVGIADREIEGYQGIHLLRRDVGDEVEFVTIMWFESIEAVRVFAGDDYEVAVVPPKARGCSRTSTRGRSTTRSRRRGWWGEMESVLQALSAVWSAALSADGPVKSLMAFLPRFVSGVVLFLIFWLVALIVRGILRRVLAHRSIGPDVARMLVRWVQAALIVIGLVTALGTMGADIGGLVASLGLVGFAVGFALKDAISNTLSGILLLVYRPFRRGDVINVAGNEGTVVNIDLRYTVLDTEGQRILVPNSSLFTNVVKVNKPVSQAPEPEAPAPEGSLRD